MTASIKITNKGIFISNLLPRKNRISGLMKTCSLFRYSDFLKVSVQTDDQRSEVKDLLSMVTAVGLLRMAGKLYIALILLN